MASFTHSSTYDYAQRLAKEALHLCLHGEPYHAQEWLLRVRNELKRVGGDLPILGSEGEQTARQERLFATETFEEARAWGSLELANGVFRLVQDLPGTSLVHFTRAWRIWRYWDLHADNLGQRDEARRERARAGLWLGEGWAHFMSDRSPYAARAILRASLAEITRLREDAILQETIEEQRLLPPPLPGSPAYELGSIQMPYVCSLLP